jgi:transposase
MGVDCALVLTYNDRLQRKQDHSFEKGLDKIQRQMNEKWTSYKRRPATVTPAVADILKESAYAACITAHVKNGQLVFTRTQEIQTRKKRFGKNLLFSAKPEDDPAWIIAQYHSKDRIEDDFKLLKDPELIRWRPCRHWTDTKIRAFGFCCVMALLLIRVMHRKAAHAGIHMSPALIKQELDDLREITIVYDAHIADVTISARSSVQQRLYDLFNLSAVENLLTRHYPHPHPQQ